MYDYTDFFGDPIDGDDMKSRAARYLVDCANEAEWMGLLPYGTWIQYRMRDGKTVATGRVINWWQKYDGYFLARPQVDDFVWGCAKDQVIRVIADPT